MFSFTSFEWYKAIIRGSLLVEPTKGYYYFPTKAIHTAMNAEIKRLQFFICIALTCEIRAEASVYSALNFTTRPHLINLL